MAGAFVAAGIGWRAHTLLAVLDHRVGQSGRTARPQSRCGDGIKEKQ